VVALVDRVRLLAGEGVRERVVELLRAERRGVAAVEGLAEHGPARPDGRERQVRNAPDRAGRDADARGAEPAGEQQLRSIHFSQLRGVIHNPWMNRIVSVGVG
jgi:hypothetical protein